jgi:hypothetical protein
MEVSPKSQVRASILSFRIVLLIDDYYSCSFVSTAKLVSRLPLSILGSSPETQVSMQKVNVPRLPIYARTNLLIT